MPESKHPCVVWPCHLLWGVLTLPFLTLVILRERSPRWRGDATEEPMFSSREPLAHDDFPDKGVMLNRFSGEASGVHCHRLTLPR